MDANFVLSILNNDNLNQEEKDILLKKLAEEYIKEEQRPSKRDLLIEKNRKQAKENRDRLEQINYNSSLKEQMEVLAYLKSNNGVPQFSKSYLLTLRGSELMQIYAECMETMPEAMEKAKEERAKDKAQGVRIFDDYKLGETKSKASDDPNVERKIEPVKEDVPQETTDEHIEDSNVNPKEEIEEEVVSKEENEVQTEEVEENSKLENIANRLGVDVDDLPKIAMQKKKKPKKLLDNLTGQRIVLEKDGSRFTKAKKFFKKHWKKVLVAGAIVGGAALTYFLLKQGMTPDVPDPSITPDTAPDPTPGPDQDFVDSLSRTTIDPVDEVYDENQFAKNGINSETPDLKYFDWGIENAVTGDDKIISAHTQGDIAELISKGEDVTSIQVGDSNGIDGHVPVNEVIDDDFMEKYQEYKSGGTIK